MFQRPVPDLVSFGSLADEIIFHVAFQNLKTLQLGQAEVATWKLTCLAFVLYCGKISVSWTTTQLLWKYNYFARFYS